MWLNVLKIVLSLLAAVWVAVIVRQILDGDDDWPQGGALA